MTILSSNMNQTNKTSQLIKVGFTANILEWYEFAIYAYLVVIMGKNFSGVEQSILKTIIAYAVFAISYVARPLGSIFYGYIGSEIGRGYALKRSLLTMAIPTALIGILPTYHQVGVVAIFGLLVLRFIQGFAAGGELPISACYVFENAPAKYKSFLSSTVSAGSSVGLLMSSAVASLLFWYFQGREYEIVNWAWRLPYLLSIPMAFWIFYIRNTIEEIQPNHSLEKSIAFSFSKIAKQMLDMLNAIKSQVLPLMGLVGFMETCVSLILFWMPVYLSHFLNVPSSVAQSVNTMMLVTYIGFSLLAGYLSRFVGYNRLLIVHILAILIFSYPLFKALQGASYGTLLGIHIIFAWLLSGIVAVMMETLGNLFDKEVRAFGMSITHTLSATLFGGPTPLLSTYFVNKTGIILLPAFYMMGFAVVALGITLYLPKLKKPLVA